MQASRAGFRSPIDGGATTQPARAPVKRLAIVILVVNGIRLPPAPCFSPEFGMLKTWMIGLSPVKRQFWDAV